MDWYNGVHRHSGIGLLTPEAVHYGRANAMTEQRAGVLAAAFAARPDRFVGGAPQPPRPPLAAWINPPDDEQAALQRHSSQRLSLLPIPLDATLASSLCSEPAAGRRPPLLLN